MVPVQDRVEAEVEVPLRLPAPVGAVGEHHDVTLAERRVDDERAAGQGLLPGQDIADLLGLDWPLARVRR